MQDHVKTCWKIKSQELIIGKKKETKKLSEERYIKKKNYENF